MNEAPELSIELTDDVAQGEYANLAIITHSSGEFVLDFIRIVPNAPKAKVKSRVIVTPQNAKRLLMALSDNVKRYESQFGRINEGDNGPHAAFSNNFNTPPGQA